MLGFTHKNNFQVNCVFAFFFFFFFLLRDLSNLQDDTDNHYWALCFYTSVSDLSPLKKYILKKRKKKDRIFISVFSFDLVSGAFAGLVMRTSPCHSCCRALGTHSAPVSQLYSCATTPIFFLDTFIAFTCNTHEDRLHDVELCIDRIV